MSLISPAMAWLGLPTRTRTAQEVTPARPRVVESAEAKRWRRNQAKAARRQRWSSRVTRARQPALTVAGLASLDAAAWTVHTTAGLAAAGISLLVLEWLTRPDEQTRR